MANVLVNETSLTEIANAIREKLEVETTYKPSEMASAISSIETGGTSMNIETGTFTLETNINSGSFKGHTINHSLGVVPKYALCFPKLSTLDECKSACQGTNQNAFMWLGTPIWCARFTITSTGTNFSVGNSGLCSIATGGDSIKGDDSTITFGINNWNTIPAGVEFEYYLIA